MKSWLFTTNGAGEYVSCSERPREGRWEDTDRREEEGRDALLPSSQREQLLNLDCSLSVIYPYAF